MKASSYCINIDTVNGQIEYRNIDLVEDILYMEVTPRHGDLPPGIPLFHTAFGRYLLLYNLDHYVKALRAQGFDLFTSSFLVNTNKVDRIVVTPHGNIAYFKDAPEHAVYISKSKTKEYRHLIKRD
ncbi:LytTR family transcriptional regulator [Paenibacillus lycopersici]|uniref:LytTR family transcriptional regulator n=1 Tax=Paenibacillus lycopersici TaxID=2704462 RepID=A0A6C0G0P2_9BACL|nr:LytTR family transcriptional regulator DNA-binding domain-containing protein [Paenibacillus lycopersici]QHT62966.1 LytTR family transcriptional regulator [Paenibacillus lycopersici]